MSASDRSTTDTAARHGTAKVGLLRDVPPPRSADRNADYGRQFLDCLIEPDLAVCRSLRSVRSKAAWDQREQWWSRQDRAQGVGVRGGGGSRGNNNATILARSVRIGRRRRHIRGDGAAGNFRARCTRGPFTTGYSGERRQWSAISERCRSTVSDRSVGRSNERSSTRYQIRVGQSLVIWSVGRRYSDVFE